MNAWYSDADIIAAVNAYSVKYEELQPLRSDPKAFTRAAIGLAIPDGVSPSAVAKMFNVGKEKGLSR